VTYGGGGSSLVSIDIRTDHPGCHRKVAEVPNKDKDVCQLNTLVL